MIYQKNNKKSDKGIKLKATSTKCEGFLFTV